jgi:hypothetical protein
MTAPAIATFIIEPRKRLGMTISSFIKKKSKNATLAPADVAALRRFISDRLLDMRWVAGADMARARQMSVMWLCAPAAGISAADN